MGLSGPEKDSGLIYFSSPLNADGMMMAVLEVLLELWWMLWFSSLTECYER